MTWMLDTNACIRYLNGRAPALRAKLDALDPAQLVVCSVVKAELYFGAALSRKPLEARSQQDYFLSRFMSLPFDDRSAERIPRFALISNGEAS
jgi:tRNA(fMet)-specific endonuclease VapC